MRQALKDWLSIILMAGVILVIALVLIWGGLSIYANVTEASPTGFPKMPSVSKAEYIFVIKATNEPILTSDFDVIADGNYLLHGFYSVDRGKWRWHETDLPLDEEYFGPISYSRRE